MQVVVRRFLVLSLCLAAPAFAATSYRLVPIRYDAAPNETLQFVKVNDSGQVAGQIYFADDPKHSRVFRWSADSGLVRLPPLNPKADEAAVGIDADGRVAALWRQPRWADRTVVWAPQQSFEKTRGLFPVASNARGDVLGNEYLVSGDDVVQTRSGETLTVTAPADAQAATAITLNDRRHVVEEVGAYRQGDFVKRPFVWRPDGGAQWMPIPDARRGADVHAINDLDVVLATSAAPGPEGNPVFVWSAADGISFVAALAGCTTYDAAGLDNAGTVVGACRLSLSDIDGFVWNAGDGIRRLIDAVDPTDAHAASAELSSAAAISPAGVILAYGSDRNDPSIRAFLLMPQ
jgi:hypothetical protein